LPPPRVSDSYKNDGKAAEEESSICEEKLMEIDYEEKDKKRRKSIEEPKFQFQRKMFQKLRRVQRLSTIKLSLIKTGQIL